LTGSGNAAISSAVDIMEELARDTKTR
jgi:hypothetical protein